MEDDKCDPLTGLGISTEKKGDAKLDVMLSVPCSNGNYAYMLLLAERVNKPRYVMLFVTPF